MDEAVYISRTDIPADDPASVYQHVGVDGALVVLVVGDCKGITSNRFFLVLGQIQPLRLLQLVVACEDLVELSGDGDLARFR